MSSFQLCDDVHYVNVVHETVKLVQDYSGCVQASVQP